MLGRIRKTTDQPTLDLAAVFAARRAEFGDARMTAGGQGDSGGAGAGAGGAGEGAAGGDAGTGAGAGGEGAAGAAAGGAGAAGAGGTAGAGAAAGTDAQDVKSLPDWAQKLITDTRAEAATHRTGKTAAEQAQQATIDKIAVALGLKGDDETDPAKLAEKVTASEAKTRDAVTQLAVFKAAGKHQGDPAALLDSRGFLAKLADLDPTAADFPSKVDEAIKSAVADNPKLKTAQAAGASGAEFTGGSGEGGARPKSIKEALSQ